MRHFHIGSKCGVQNNPKGAKHGVLSCALLITVFTARIAIAQSPPETDLTDLLERTGATVEAFWDQISGVTCIESVSQMKLGKEKSVLYRQDSVFDYLILMHLMGDDISVEESRFLQQNKGKAESRPLLVTSGFSTLALIFHPYYQGSFEFQNAGNAIIAGKPFLKVHFQHVLGSRAPSVLRLKGKDYPLRWKGSAWIQPQTGQIQRIIAHLSEPMPEVGLLRLDSEVLYAGVRFLDTGEEYWLPQTASIEAETAHQRWLNTHRFSDYKQFTVKTRSDVAKK